MQQNLFIDESLDSFVVSVAGKVPSAGGVIWLFPAHVIFHSLRAISSDASPPHSRLHLILYHVSLLLYHLSSIHWFLFKFFTSSSFLNFVPYSSNPHYCKMMHSNVLHLNTIDYTLSHLLKVRKALQTPVSLFLLAANSKWAGSYTQTSLIYTSNSNTQIIHTLHSKNKKVGERKREGKKGRESPYFRIKLHTQDQTWDLKVQPRPCHRHNSA